MVTGNNKHVRKIFSSLSEGFTLVEMIVVIAILGMLAAVVLAAVNPFAQVQKANDARRKADLESLQHALELYYQDKGTYPPSSANYRIQVGATTYNWGSSWTPYMTTLPKDPLPSDSYIYYAPGGQTYYLYANLQRGASDPQACNRGNPCASLSGSGFPAASACGGTCNYGVTSTNVAP